MNTSQQAIAQDDTQYLFNRDKLQLASHAMDIYFVKWQFAFTNGTVFWLGCFQSGSAFL